MYRKGQDMARKRSRMTDKWRCALLITWLRKRKVKFRIHAWRPRAHLKSGYLYKGATGQAEVRERFSGAPIIRVWAPKDGYRNGWRDVTNCIIHEYGHIALMRTPHTEREAWRFGRRSVPKRFVPANYADAKRRRLGTYGTAADRRLAWRDRVQ